MLGNETNPGWAHTGGTSNNENVVYLENERAVVNVVWYTLQYIKIKHIKAGSIYKK